MVNGGLYVRGLVEQGKRKSLEPMVARMGGEAEYQSMQQFLADSPWDPALVIRAVAERVAPKVDVQAWVLDDTGFPKDGKRSPGVKRQYSGTLGKIGNCQIGVSLHAAGARGTVPLGWALYLPEEWCVDRKRRKKAKIPAEIGFKTKPQLGVELAVRAAGWKIGKAPVLGDSAYGDNTELRDKLHGGGLRYVLSVSPETTVFSAETRFAVPEQPAGKRGRPNSSPHPDREAESIGQLIARLGEKPLKTVAFRDGPDGKPLKSRFMFVRVRSAHHWRPHDRRWAKGGETPPREEWLIAEWPKGKPEPPTTGSPTCPPPPSPGGSPGSRGCAGRSSSTTASSKASSASTTTKDAPGLAGITTPRWSPLRTASSPSSASTHLSPTHGLTLEQAVLLLQPIFKCWARRCSTCQQPVDLDQLPLQHPRQDE
jgi:SRSO17 transposase